MKGGYQLVDFGGLDLTNDQTSQTISGLYERLDKALKAKKLIVGENMVYGTGKQMSPVSLFGFVPETGYVKLIYGVYIITVSDANVAVVTSEIPEPESDSNS